MGQKVPIDILPVRWGSQPYPPVGYLDRWTRGVTVFRGYPESEPGFKIFQQIEAASDNKAAGSYIYANASGQRYVLYYRDTKLFREEDDPTPASIKTGLTATYCPGWACMASPAAFGLFVNGADAPVGVRDAGSSTIGAFNANLESPNANWTATGATSGGSLADGTYYVRIAQIEVDSVTGTIISGPSAVKTATISGGGGSGKITVAQSTWTPNSRASHWRIGVSSSADSPELFLGTAAMLSIVIATSSYDVTTLGTLTAFENRNGFYKVADLTEIISGKHPRGVVLYEGRFVVWYGNDNRILWSERDEWGWYETNSLDTGAEGGWNLPVRCIVPMNGFMLVFTEASIHGVFGDLSRDLLGAAPSYAANAVPKTLEQGIGILGGVEAAKNLDGTVYFMSSVGPAAWDGRTRLLEPEDIRQERKAWDFSSGYADRVVVERDPQTGAIWFLVPRKTNSARPMDGGSTAGIPDTCYRWLPSRGVWDAPYQLDLVHLSARTNGAKATGSSGYGPVLLMACNPFGGVAQLGFGNAGGDADGVVTSTDFDGKLASANNTTDATIALTGISADALIGMTVTLRYPSGDSTYPYVFVQKTISDNDATSGSTTKLYWKGAVTVPSTSFWTVRLCGRLCASIADLDPRNFLGQIAGANAASYFQLHEVEARFKDKVGAEATS